MKTHVIIVAVAVAGLFGAASANAALNFNRTMLGGDASQKGATQKGATQKGATQKGATQKCDGKGSVQKGCRPTRSRSPHFKSTCGCDVGKVKGCDSVQKCGGKGAIQKGCGKKSRQPRMKSSCGCDMSYGIKAAAPKELYGCDCCGGCGGHSRMHGGRLRSKGCGAGEVVDFKPVGFGDFDY